MRTFLSGICMLLTLGLINGCGGTGDQPQATVPTPQMPAGWKVVEDFLASPAELQQFSSKMNVDLLGVRNTSFEVEGLRIKVNTILTANPADAEQAWGYLKGMKSEQALVKRGTTLYEFVGTSEVNHLIPVAKKHLESS